VLVLVVLVLVALVVVVVVEEEETHWPQHSSRYPKPQTFDQWENNQKASMVTGLRLKNS
jgi:hypothetical protein